MPNVSFEAAARAGASARAFVQQLGRQATLQGDESSSSEGASSFGDMLLARQQTLTGGPTTQVVVPETLPLSFSNPGGPSAAGAPTERLGVELNPILVSESKLQIPTRTDEPKAADGTAITRGVVGPDGKTGNTFGHWELKPAARPYSWLQEGQLTEKQQRNLEKWKQSPVNMVWRYDVEPGADNNWAGWGPPPPGWTTRSEIPRIDGAYMGKGLPWPPPGEPIPWGNGGQSPRD